jgi:amino acid adenylation domain-containing protein
MLLEPFLRQCQIRPHALAVAEGGRQAGYAELLARAQAIAAALQKLGIGRGQRVSIHLERGMDASAAVLGALLAGACYVPLDLKNPPSRLAFIMADAQPAAALGCGPAPAGLQGARWLDISACPAGNGDVAVHSSQMPSQLAAILYTSGSSGQPKGVALSHAAIAAFAEWAAACLALDSADRIAASAPLFFDLSTFDLYAALGRGASLHFLPPALSLAPARLSAWLQAEAITGWYTVPSLLAFLAYKGNLAHTPLPSLRFLAFAGEVFPTPALMRLAELLPATALHNFFGPTETNVCCHWPVDRRRLEPEHAIPIGLPAAGDSLHIHAATGELWVRGPTLASGYWGGGRLQPLLNEAGWYPTGDRVSRNAAGELLFQGRLGRMLKCAGHRVEPAEIETAALALAGVRECAVIGVADPAAGQRPLLLAVLEGAASLGELRQALRQGLPAYMQPQRFILLERLPRLANGKLDYQALQALAAAQ